MFGYINAAKEQLGEEDYKVFCSYYCGLCKQLGKSCSQMSRLGLSYDITFLFIVLSSVTDIPYEQKEERCIAVEMEIAGVQSVCDFHNLDLYAFIVTGDILSEEKYEVEGLHNANHSLDKLFIALEIAKRL